MGPERTGRTTQEIDAILAKLSLHQRNQLEEAAEGYHDGGTRVAEPLYSTAVKLELVYKSSGRLRPDVYKVLQPGQPVMVTTSSCY